MQPGMRERGPLKGALPTAEMFALQYPVRAAFSHRRPPHHVFPPSVVAVGFGRGCAHHAGLGALERQTSCVRRHDPLSMDAG